MSFLDEDLAEIIDAQVDRMSENEDMTVDEARFNARERVRRTASRYIDEDSLFDDASQY
jgi:hypothetical protein